MNHSPGAPARIVAPDARGLAEAARRLRAGEVVGLPTETVYGLAGHAFDEQALARIFAAKERPAFDPLIVHVALAPGESPLAALGGDRPLADLDAFAPAERARLERVLLRFWPGPLTVVLPKAPGVPDLATSGLPSVGLRAPRHPAAQALIRAAGFPLAAPSANRFGRISPTRAEDVLAELGERIPLIVDGGPCEIGLESTVVAWDADGRVRLLRPGGVAPEALATELGRPLERGLPPTLEHARGVAPQLAPGLLESHYAPAKPLTLFERPLTESDDAELRARFGAEVGDAGVLTFGESAANARSRIAQACGTEPAAVLTLSERGDLAEAAARLFRELRALDAQPATRRLFARPCPPGAGLAHAIRDRLSRAAAKRG